MSIFGFWTVENEKETKVGDSEENDMFEGLQETMKAKGIQVEKRSEGDICFSFPGSPPVTSLSLLAQEEGLGSAFYYDSRKTREALQPHVTAMRRSRNALLTYVIVGLFAQCGVFVTLKEQACVFNNGYMIEVKNDRLVTRKLI